MEAYTLSLLTRRFLSNNNLSGTVPSSFGLLTSMFLLCARSERLSSIDPSYTDMPCSMLDSNHLSGTIPPSLGSMNGLVILCVRSACPVVVIGGNFGHLTTHAAI